MKILYMSEQNNNIGLAISVLSLVYNLIGTLCAKKLRKEQ